MTRVGEIEQVDAVLAEDDRTVILYGHTADDRVTFTASFVLPFSIDRSAFLAEEWSNAENVEWTCH